jgi:hypothetical protein
MLVYAQSAPYEILFCEVLPDILPSKIKLIVKKFTGVNGKTTTTFFYSDFTCIRSDTASPPGLCAGRERCRRCGPVPDDDTAKKFSLIAGFKQFGTGKYRKRGVHHEA